MRKKGIMLLFLFVLSLTFIQAQPPFEQSLNLDKGIQLEIPIIESIEQGKDFKFHVHTHNVSDGLLIPQSEILYCSFHLYNTANGGHLIEDNMTADSNGIDWEYEVAGGNFSEIGQYAIVIYCEVEDEIGGFFEFGFDVTKNGKMFYIAEAILYLILSFGILLLSCITFYFMLITPYSNEMNEKQNLIIRVTRTKYIKLGLILITYALFTWFLNIMIGLSENFASLTMYYGLFGGIFWIMNALSLPVAVVIIVVMLFEIIRDANIEKKIKALGSATR